MNQVYEKLQNCLKSVREKTDFVPEVALILGSGLGEYAEEIEVVTTINYNDIEGFPVSTVAGHKGRFIFGYVNKVPVVIMQGRVHFYEGYPMTDVVLPTRLMGLLGAKTLLLTNACGGVNKEYHAGDFMLIRDHIATSVPSPLLGENIEELGPRFPDMSDVYRRELRGIIKEVAKEEGIELQEGVYLQLSGPAYESPAEVQMCRILGADAVGMSTACEALAANHMGMKVCGISCITNMACGITDQPLSHAEVQETADRVAPIFKKLITASITKIAGK
ncbi:purine-nucleoside phosphorylase [Lacrimispora algidixylanolytica]|jgi:purine-nucleoside phosphorylase|uniref:Purine nucleoside phosphorylase n=1 Tax=Lacrimispora algidixylanolytica TaxID=94868 RepID=A0A419T296_9FIRM|nr:purine-nucleoside phosphorylase [Lacrimispora algidixylanolytica]RKD31617.1 purine-nucleoside phosphorylase [Lacrimispora algidixylanolytica]